MNDTNLLENQPIAWTPSPDVIERSRLMQFMRQVGLSTWDELYQFSIRDVERFTEEVLKFLDIKFDPPYLKLLDTSNGPEFPTWFQRSADTPVRTTSPSINAEAAESPSEDNSVRTPSAGLNITEMCLDRWLTDEIKDQPAVIWEGEEGRTTTFTYAELLGEVEYVATNLRHNGIQKGDAVGIHLPMIPETVATLLAINRIGAIAVPVFSGYGVEAIANRLNAVKAKAIVTFDAIERRGKHYYAYDIAQDAMERCPSIQFHILVRHADVQTSHRLNNGYREYGLESSIPVNGGVEPTSAEDPLIILYTSGTTGKPKGVAHTHASFPIKAAQDMAFGTDVGRGTRICWYTDIGWMMGPWLIYGALINGATICLYDGAPDYPTPDRMWEFCAKHKVEVLGISPTLVRSLAAAEGEPRSADTPVRTNDPQRRGWYWRGGLPHFDGEVTQFITFRLADSLPNSVLDRLKLEIEHGKLDDISEAYRERIDEYLDQGAGKCILGDPRVAEIVLSTLHNEDGRSCDLKSWVIMPNHAHVMLRMKKGHDLASLMKRVKGISARRINELLGRSGAVWQAEYFDRYIRDEEHFEKVRGYIENNPVAAGLVSEAQEFRFSSAYPSREIADKSVRPPFERHDLSSLRAFASTGEPWNPAPWWWLFQKVGNSKLPIINYSGGTEIAGGILMGNPLLPIKPCSFPAPCPGMDVDILDEDGNPVPPGKVGELVIKQPWIGMARGFWQERERYLDTYWNRFPGIWVHGDWAMRDEDGHWFILGRSDDTLKVAGKRVGPAEVESLLVAHPLVTEAAVIGVPDEVKGTAMVAFVVLGSPDTSLRKNDSPTEAVLGDSGSSPRNESPARGAEDADRIVLSPLEAELKSLVSKDMGKPLAPSKIHFVSALPKTRNAKVMRRVIRSAYLGEDPGDLSALENPQAIEEIGAAGK